MLQFLKKNIKKDKNVQPSTNHQSVNGGSLPVGVLLPTLSESSSEGPLSNFQHDGYTDRPPPQQSRLSVTLEETLQDRVALSYFSQFTEQRGFSLLLNLWLDLQELQQTEIAADKCEKTNVNRTNSVVNSGSTKVIGERTCRLRTASDSASPISHRKVWQRYLSEDVIQRFMLPEDTCAQIQAAGVKELTDGSAVQQLKEYVYQVMKKELWHDFVRSEYFSKFQVEVLTSGSVTLSDIMYHPAAVTAFTEFLEQEGCHLVVEFWQTATAFQHHLRPDSDPISSQNEAINIYDKYLSLQATSPLGVDNATRCEVEQRICVEAAAPRKDCLEPALRKAWAYLRYVCLPLFLSSQNYVQLISDLMRATRSNSSPASSVTDISVESRNRYDPDVIWKRRHHHRGLSIGRIDQLGRFETDIEPEPDKKSESRISRVVKKLVNKDEPKAQEEMAWRVAEMIVKDVTNLTMGGQADDDDDT